MARLYYVSSLKIQNSLNFFVNSLAVCTAVSCKGPTFVAGDTISDE